MKIMRVEAKHGRVDTETTDALVLLFVKGKVCPRERTMGRFSIGCSEGHSMSSSIKGV